MLFHSILVNRAVSLGHKVLPEEQGQGALVTTALSVTSPQHLGSPEFQFTGDLQHRAASWCLQALW